MKSHGVHQSNHGAILPIIEQTFLYEITNEIRESQKLKSPGNHEYLYEMLCRSIQQIIAVFQGQG